MRNALLSRGVLGRNKNIMLTIIYEKLFLIISEPFRLLSHVIIYYPNTRIGNFMRKIYYKSIIRLRIGKKPTIRRAVIIHRGAHVEIGDNFSIGPNVTIDPNYSFGVIIGNNVGISEGSFLRSSNHDYSDLSIPTADGWCKAKMLLTNDNKKASIIIEDDVWIAAHSIILSGARIRRGSIVSAGSVVSFEVPEYAIVAGNPARIIANRKKIDFSKHNVGFR